MKGIREMVRDVVTDEDKLYFMRDGVTPDEGYKLLVKDRHVLQLVKASNMTGVCKIHVYHAYSNAPAPRVVEDSDNDEELLKESETNKVMDVEESETEKVDVEENKELPKKCTIRKRTT